MPYTVELLSGERVEGGIPWPATGYCQLGKYWFDMDEFCAFIGGLSVGRKPRWMLRADRPEGLPLLVDVEVSPDSSSIRLGEYALSAESFGRFAHQVAVAGCGSAWEQSPYAALALEELERSEHPLFAPLRNRLDS